jgi:hypothetical protein
MGAQPPSRAIFDALQRDCQRCVRRQSRKPARAWGGSRRPVGRPSISSKPWLRALSSPRDFNAAKGARQSRTPCEGEVGVIGALASAR